MTEPLHRIKMILFGIITDSGNGLLFKASKSRLKLEKAASLDFTIKSRLFANPDTNGCKILLWLIYFIESKL